MDFRGLVYKTGAENYIFWSEIGLGFEVSSRIYNEIYVFVYEVQFALFCSWLFMTTAENKFITYDVFV